MKSLNKLKKKLQMNYFLDLDALLLYEKRGAKCCKRPTKNGKRKN